MALSPSEVFSLARGAGFDPATAAVMVAIAGAESGWNPAAVGDVALQDRTWGPSIGLWQVRSLKAETGTGSARDGSRLTDPAFNARAAYQIFKGQGLGAWSTYSNGSYRQFLGTASTAASSTGSTAAPAGLNIPNPLDIPGKVAGGIADGLWAQVQPLWVKSLFVVAGLALVVVGVSVAASPSTGRVLHAAGVPDLGGN